MLAEDNKPSGSQQQPCTRVGRNEQSRRVRAVSVARPTPFQVSSPKPDTVVETPTAMVLLADRQAHYFCRARRVRYAPPKWGRGNSPRRQIHFQGKPFYGRSSQRRTHRSRRRCGGGPRGGQQACTIVVSRMATESKGPLV